MTEYELADIALSTQSLFWQQAQTSAAIVELIQAVIDRIATLLFGFLTVTYLVGPKLSRGQATLFSVLYLFWQLRLVFISGELFRRLEVVNLEMAHSGQVEIEQMSWMTQGLPTVLLLLICVAASVYFMWSIRHPKEE